MKRLSLFSFVLVAAALFAAPAVPMPKPSPHPLVWDTMEKEITPRPEEDAADFVFNVTNASAAPIEIREVRPMCPCTTVEAPPTPWTLAPGAKGSFRGTISFRGKSGRFSKPIYILSSGGTQMLGVVVNLPDAPAQK